MGSLDSWSVESCNSFALSRSPLSKCGRIAIPEVSLSFSGVNWRICSARMTLALWDGSNEPSRAPRESVA